MERSTVDGLTLLSDLVGAMAKDRRTCLIRLTDGAREGLLRFEHGRVVEVSFGRHEGASAMVALTQATGLHHEIVATTAAQQESDATREALAQHADAPQQAGAHEASQTSDHDPGAHDTTAHVNADSGSAAAGTPSESVSADSREPDEVRADAESPNEDRTADSVSADSPEADELRADAEGPNEDRAADSVSADSPEADELRDGDAPGVAPRRSDFPPTAPKTRPMWGSLLLGALVLSTAALLWTRGRQRPPVTPRAVEEHPHKAAATRPTRPPETQPPEWREGPRAIALAGGPLVPSVSLRVLVSSEGRVQRAEVSAPRPNLAQLEQRAIATALKQRYRPAMRDGKPVETWTTLVLALEPAPESGSQLLIKGSEAIASALGPLWTRSFEASHPGLALRVEALGTKTGFAGLLDGTADLAAASCPIADEELAWAERLGITLREIVLGQSAIAIVVHPDNPLRELDLATLAQIFTREVTRWDALSGEAAEIHALSRPSYAGTRSAMEARLPAHEAPTSAALGLERVETEQEVIARVAGDVHAIGYVSLGALQSSVRALALKGAPDAAAILPTRAAIAEGTYPLPLPLLLYLRSDANPDARAFVQFAVSKAGQELLAQRGLVARPSPGPRLTLDAAFAPAAPADLTRIYFETNSAHIVKARWDEFWAQAARLRAGRRALIIGYTDSSGDPEANRRLARVRASVVRDLLQRMGSGKAEIELEVARSEYPLAAHDTPEGKSSSRRVDLFVVPH